MDVQDDKVMQKRQILKFDLKKMDEQVKEVSDDIAVEFALTIKVNGEEFATMICTPTHLKELVIGFLASEGLIRFKEDIEDINIDINTGFAFIELKNKSIKASEFNEKRFVGSCCGKSRQFYFQNDVKTAKTINSKMSITVPQCLNLMSLLEGQSKHFKKTGGVHQGALCNSTDIVIFQSDIGRHNVLDKIYGQWLFKKMTLQDKCIVFSGRISSEVLLKVAKIGVGLIISKSAPTNLALDLADDLGITVIGFVRGSKLNVYTHPERIIT
ncbi:formate dehydrogenase accessory sulfurtransferase FdhD [Chengkuizengella sediminis]|uniref:formate dehydrogenase accessory sulfurtransferase FdhD n=1 Tax=Chengkuizengella sediminis TaxID=1885917 RepID=UPI00138957D9|nr:formate dehydrogenase accessory sulfurtransferase FdhD [Chengkuizengella sediminis]NDI36147.1 formate dehydrogenase accessory sulfurtransferase FdhD [Chengkuizengella sediminis]